MRRVFGRTRRELLGQERELTGLSCVTDEWGQKAKRRHTTGTGRMAHLKSVSRRFKNGFVTFALPFPPDSQLTYPLAASEREPARRGRPRPPPPSKEFGREGCGGGAVEVEGMTSKGVSGRGELVRVWGIPGSSMQTGLFPCSWRGGGLFGSAWASMGKGATRVREGFAGGCSARTASALAARCVPSAPRALSLLRLSSCSTARLAVSDSRN